MKDLIEALNVFLKYSNESYPTACEHDVLYMMVSPADVTDADKETLEALGFYADDEEDHFYSFKYGSC